MEYNRFKPRGGIVTALLAVCLALMGVGTLPAQTHSAHPKSAVIKVPHLNYRLTNLSNGLKVVTLEDHHAPVITLQIWYHVGSKDEAPGKAGFAHMFEHLMFKGSAHVGPEEHAHYIEQVGGDYNANTSFDRTLFFETVPSNTLDRTLWLEADRMTSLRVDQPNMVSERAVVEEEHRLDVENAPYGRLFEYVGDMLFPNGHPYGHPTIGVMGDLDKAVLADVQAFHNEYYKPNDATLVLVGDFKTSEALSRIRQYFGSIPKGTRPFTRYPFPTITQTAEQRATYYDKLAPLPLVVVAFRLPSADSSDTPVFDVMSYILSTGNSSRLYRALVRDQQIATQVGGSSYNLKYAGIFFFDAVANAGKRPEDVEKALNAQIEQLRAQLVSQEELAKAKNQALNEKVFGTISTEERASDLGEADLLYGTPEEANRELAQLQAVTAADVQRVAQKYFAPDLRNIIYMLPASMQPGSGSGANATGKESSR